MSDIKKSDIAEKNLFGDIGESAKLAKGQVDLLQDSLSIIAKEAANIKKSMPTKTPNNTAELKKQIELQKDANVAANEKIKLDNQLIKAEAKLALTTKEQRQALAKVRIENQRLNKEAKVSVLLQDKSTGAYKRQSIVLNDLNRRYKDLAVSGRAGGKVARGMLVEINKLNAGLSKADASTGRFGRNVGNYPKTLGKATAGLKSFAGALGLTSGIFLLAQGLKDGVKLIADFEQANANLASILGTTKGGISDLTEDAKRLGQVTANTASEITELQTELAKLGFNKREILDSTEAIQQLAQATGTDLAQSAIQVGGALRTFGLDAKESGRVVDVLASSTSKSALDMSKLATSLPLVGSTAKVAGVSLERTTALLGVLSDRGLDASTSGTSLRNIFLELSKQGLTWEEAMGKINNATDKNATALELFGKRGATSAIILAENGASADELTKSLEESGGVAKNMADTQLDTLTGSVTLLKSAYEGFILSLESGDGQMSNWLRQTVDATASVLNLLSGVEQTDEQLRNIKFGETALKIRDFIDTWADAFTSVDNFRNALKDTADILTTIVTLGIIENVSDDYLGLADAVEKYEAEQREAIRITALAQHGIKKLTKSVTEYTAKEQAKINLLASGNLTQEQRNKLINSLNKDYPELLANYDLENLSQEDAIKLNKELQKEIIETAILKEKTLVLNIASNRLAKEQAKVDLITNKETRARAQEQLDFEYKRQLARIDAVEEETRIRLGLKELDDEVTEAEIENNKVVVADQKQTNIKIEKEHKRHKDEINKIDLDAARKRQLATDLVIEDRVDPQIEIDRKEEEARQLALEKQKAYYKNRGELIQAFTDKSIESADERINTLDDEISAAQKQADYFKQLADNGNIDAEQSLAEQNQIIADAEAQKQKIERQKQAIELISSVVVAYNNELADGKTSSEAFKSATTGTAAISAFIAALPTFMDGIENTGAQGNGIDGKGGFLSVLHPNERVLTKGQNSMIGDISNDELAQVMQNYRLGSFDIGETTINQAINTKNLEDKMDAVTEAINNKKEIDVIELTRTAMLIRETTKKGNFKTTNRFKVN